jgi:hypothetical protein
MTGALISATEQLMAVIYARLPMACTESTVMYPAVHVMLCIDAAHRRS